MNPEYGVADSQTMPALVDLTAKKSVYLGRQANPSSFFSPRTLCTDGTYLYASLFRTDSPLTLNDGLDDGSNTGVSSILYKVDTKLNIVDRLTLQDISVFVSCTATAAGTPVFMLKVDKDDTADIYRASKKGSTNYGSFKYGAILFISDAFGDNPVTLHKVEGDNSKEMTIADMDGTLVSAGKDDLFVAALLAKTKLAIDLISLSSFLPYFVIIIRSWFTLFFFFCRR